MVTPEMYCAEKGSTKILNPSFSRTKSSSALLSSMSRLYLKPLHPPGWTLTRSPPISPVTPSASMNFLTSTVALSVTVSSISGVVDVDIDVLQGTLQSYVFYPSKSKRFEKTGLTRRHEATEDGRRPRGSRISRK